MLAALGQDPGIVRNKLKIRAAVNNARIFRTIQREWGSFDRYLWHWTEGKTISETGKVSSELSDAVSEDLKRRGMKFVGTVIIYSYLQAVESSIPTRKPVFAGNQSENSQMYRKEDSRGTGCPLFMSSGKSPPYKTGLKKIPELTIMKDTFQVSAKGRIQAAGALRGA